MKSGCQPDSSGFSLSRFANCKHESSSLTARRRHDIISKHVAGFDSSRSRFSGDLGVLSVLTVHIEALLKQYVRKFRPQESPAVCTTRKC
jgi:hypothetical protein